MNLEKLKETARKFEQKEEWRKAIDVYLKAIQQVEEGTETSPDLSLYNRIGDLYLKISDMAAAVRSYERAVDLYADQGFFNNAIALCGKILRVNPGRTQTYLKLAQLHARKNVVIEAKRNLIEFLERMNALGQLDLAFESVKTFADQFAGSQEIRMMLVELLRAASREDEARQQLEKLVDDLEALGDAAGARRTRERLQATDYDVETAPPPAPPVEQTPRAGDLIFLDTGFSPVPPPPSNPAPGLVPTADLTAAEAPPPMPLAGLETTSEVDLSPVADDVELPVVESLEIERIEPADVDFEGGRLEGMEGTPLELTEDIEILEVDTAESDSEVTLDFVDMDPKLDIEELDVDELAIEEPAVEEPIELGSGEPAVIPVRSEIVSMEEEPAEEVVLTSLEDQVLDDPDNPDLHRDLADALFTADQPERAIDELDLALVGYEARGLWIDANGIVDRFLAVYPDSVRHHQKRVELAYRTGGSLVAAYLGLGDALARIGATEKAIAVFRRVQEHDPGNVPASSALAVLSQEPALPREAQHESSDSSASSRPFRPPARPAIPGVPIAAAPPPPPAGPVPPPDAPTLRPVSDAPLPPPSNDAGFVDFGAMVLEEQGPRDTRMRVDRREPAGDDEQREFREILEQFKRGIEENLDVEDYDSHYDLGVAFKEMGLLDEAVAEFQKAARTPSPPSRLRASEALGITFYERGHYAVAETVLRRALEAVERGDEVKIGLIYWLGRSVEAQGKELEAIAIYERALAVDIRFMDLGERVSRLTAEPRS